MTKKKVIFLGSKPIGYECLAYLVSQRDILDVEITAVLTNDRKEFGSGGDVSILAVQNDIPVLDSPDEMPVSDIIYSVQYHKILKQEHIKKAADIAVNLHMAPLPEYRGSNQFSFAIIEDKSEFGATIHRMDTRIDHGDILFQKRFPVPADCWVEELYQLTFDASLNLFKQTLGHIISGNFTAVPQQLLEVKYGTSLHYRSEMAKLKEIDLSWEPEKIARHIRATSMPGFEPPYCLINGEKVYLTRKK